MAAKHFQRPTRGVTGEELASALRTIQDAVRAKFGKNHGGEWTGERAIYIAPDRVELTNEHGTVVADEIADITKYLCRPNRGGK